LARRGALFGIWRSQIVGTSDGTQMGSGRNREPRPGRRRSRQRGKYRHAIGEYDWHGENGTTEGVPKCIWRPDGRPMPLLEATAPAKPVDPLSSWAVLLSPGCEVPPYNKQATTASSPMGN